MTVRKIKSIGDVPYPIDTHSDAFSPLLTAGAALGITGEATNSAAWLRRVSTSDGPTTVRSIHGRTLRWNQLVSDSDTSVTVPSGHKYVARIDGTTTLATSDGTAITVTGGTDNVLDLTAMFGAGSEPTAAEFEAMYHASYPYDAGSLLPVNMMGVESVAADESWTQQRTIPAGTLRGAGTVYDEQTATERITRVGEVALSEISWTFDSEHKRFSSPVISTIVQTVDAAHPLAQTARLDALAAGGTVDAVDGFTVSSNKIWLSVEASQPTIATSEALNTWLAANCPTMHVALATPTTTPIDPPLNMTYRTANGGTERIVVPTGENSAPPTIVAAQGYTAESLRDAALATIAPVENGKASTNYGIGSYLVHGGQLCKVTTAIATGESITIGTNVTATTVMAEVIALTQ